MVLKFSEQFWDKDFNGTVGYDTIIERMKDGKRMCDTLVEFLEKRAKLEHEYGTGLIKIINVTEMSNETGTLRESWESIKKESANIGYCHLDVSRRLMELMSKVQEFRNSQKNERNRLDEKMKKLQKEKKIAYENVVKTKKNYEAKCKDMDQQKETLETKASYTPREEEKLKKNIGKAKTNVENADSQYLTCLKTLDDNRMRWILEMEDTCDKFQEMELQRIKFLRNEMWMFTNVGSLLSVDVDKNYENSRLVLEKCSETHDLELFVQTKKTGTSRPAEIKYEYYYGQKNVDQPTNDDSESPYSVVMYDSQKHGHLRRAVYKYAQQGPKELNLHAGDIIEVLRKEDDDWGIGKLNGNVGAFPFSFTEPM